MCVETLRAEGLEPVGYWDNPNIHPYTEYRSRKNALVEYAAGIGLTLLTPGVYGLRPYLKEVGADFESRCEACYRMRMRSVAACAAQNGFDHISTTLLISPYQNHELLCRVAAEEAEKHGVRFLYRDFRPHFREGQARARELGLYMQKYCGCIFSEEERYQKRKKPKEAAQNG